MYESKITDDVLIQFAQRTATLKKTYDDDMDFLDHIIPRLLGEETWGLRLFLFLTTRLPSQVLLDNNSSFRLRKLARASAVTAPHKKRLETFYDTLLLSWRRDDIYKDYEDMIEQWLYVCAWLRWFRPCTHVPDYLTNIIEYETPPRFRGPSLLQCAGCKRDYDIYSGACSCGAIGECVGCGRVMSLHSIEGYVKRKARDMCEACYRRDKRKRQ